MSDIKIEADYINYQFHVWSDGQMVETGLSVEVQKALMRQVITDCTTVFKQALQSQLSEAPPGLESMMPHE